jgi:nitrogen fixation/metabolism regulation signal transduction histidine kinase
VQAVAPFAEIARLRHFASSSTKQWEEQMEYRRRRRAAHAPLRGTRLAQRGENGYVVVFDDITHLIQAQRDAAWGEVARRLAHEIKNPLTPIQLSAERLQHKLKDKLPAHEADILQRATGTIVTHVAALKGMVGRLHAVRPCVADERARDHAERPGSRSAGALRGDGRGDRGPARRGPAADLRRSAMLRQVLHNLFQNAIDALTGVEQPKILVSTSQGRAACC